MAQSRRVNDVGTEWPDARLNELARRVENAATRSELQALREDMRRELRERSDGVKRDVAQVSVKLDELTGDPITERRAKRQAMVVAVIAALSGVAGTSLLYFATGGPH